MDPNLGPTNGCGSNLGLPISDLQGRLRGSGEPEPLRVSPVPYVLGGPGLRWLTAVGGFQGDSAELKLYRVDGGVFNSASPAPQETEYGTLSVHFDDCNSGKLHYDIPSLSRHGVVPIQRIATDTIPVCEQAQIRQDAALLEVMPGNKDVLENFCGGHRQLAVRLAGYTAGQQLHRRVVAQ